jgi:hypothetical protein
MEPIIQILISAGGATVIAAFINAVMNRRKLSAEATEIITKAAAGTVENVMKDNSTLRERIAHLEILVKNHEETIRIAESREREHLLAEERHRRHEVDCRNYTGLLATQLRALGGTVPDPPPIYRPPGA